MHNKDFIMIPYADRHKESALSGCFIQFELSHRRDRKMMENALKKALSRAAKNSTSQIFVTEDHEGNFPGYI